MRNYLQIGEYYLSFRSWRVRKANGDVEAGTRITVESRGLFVLDYYFAPSRDNVQEAHKRISAYLHSSRRGVILPEVLAPKMGNLEYRNMITGVRIP